MIIVDFTLLSAVSGKRSPKGLILIDNVSQYKDGNVTLADYRVRAYPKNITLQSALRGAKPHRTGKVLGHPKHAKPVWNLMLKALKELRYED